MSALQLELYSDYAPPMEQKAASNHLRLEIVAPSPLPVNRVRTSSRRRNRAYRRDNAWLMLAVSAIVAFALVSFVTSTVNQARTNFLPISSTQPLVANVTVHSGDTLWKFAHKYGSPDNYVLDNVETIARTNNLSVDSPLTPGQQLHIPVTNPTILAAISAKQKYMVASR
jgi:nucleoid-associated protein YgaU